jgi:hypothetical protein
VATRLDMATQQSERDICYCSQYKKGDVFHGGLVGSDLYKFS